MYIVILLCRVTYGNSGQEKKKARILIYAEYIMRNAGLDEAQAGIKIAGRNINNLRYADDNTLMAESEDELKRRVKNLA